MKHFYSIAILVLILTGSMLQTSAAFIVHHPVSDSSSTSKNDSSNISSALIAFRHLSRAERRERIKEAKSAIKEYKTQQNATGEASTNQLLLVVLAIILPPLAVYLHEGVINSKFWLDLILTLLFFLPGVIYALIVVLG